MHVFQNTMAFAVVNDCSVQDFNGLLAIEEDIFNEDENLSSEIEKLLIEIEEEPAVDGYKCGYCEKICKSKQGLTRHQKVKHQNDFFGVSTVSKQIDPTCFQHFINKSVSKLVNEGCYSDETLHTLRNYCCSSDEEASYTYKFVSQVVESFDGNAEKFFPSFYDCVSGDNIIFQNLDKRCSTILGFELANVVLAHLNSNDILTNNTDPVCMELNSKERNITKYLSGYVIHTLYFRLRKSAKHKNDINTKHLSLLLATKDLSTPSSVDDTFTDSRNRGGLWRVKKEVSEIFFVVEKFFRNNVEFQAADGKIDIESMIISLLKYSTIISNFTTLCAMASEEVPDEISKNLLECMLRLYLRARTFKYVSLKKEKFKLTEQKKKMKSLRTSIKQSTKKLEHGH